MQAWSNTVEYRGPIYNQTNYTGKHAYSLSQRVSIRWPPEEPYENTETVVLSVNNFFVDLRVEKGPSRKLEWAIAGVRLVDANDSRRVTFLHTINSRNTFQHIDTGVFTSLENGEELETGTAFRPGDTSGFPRQYEEVWRPRKIISVPGSNIAWILEGAGSHISLVQNADGVGSEESKEVETFLARIGGTYIAVRQPTRIVGTPIVGNPGGGGYQYQKFGDVEGVSIRHEEWAGKRGWIEKFVWGPECKDLPTMQKSKSDFIPAQEGKGNWRKPSEKVTIRGEEYVVRGFADIP